LRKGRGKKEDGAEEEEVGSGTREIGGRHITFVSRSREVAFRGADLLYSCTASLFTLIYLTQEENRNELLTLGMLDRLNTSS
tara:strand:- start:400 stop:645 length:246 start_codon:yes stop_codon:yes gene_type:complete